jgi:uncharacterized protein (TIGR02266 family)
MTTRKSDRVQAQLPVQVSCDTWADFVDLYTKDISHGGMFIQSTSAPPLYSKVTVVLKLPGEVAELMLPAEVVHIVAAERRSGSNEKQGFGVHLGDLDDETRRAVEALVQHAQDQADEEEGGGFLLEAVHDLSSGVATEMASGDEYQLIMELREELATFKELDDFDVLGLQGTESVNDVRTAFFQTTKQWHPDKYQRAGPEVRSLATQIFIRIKEAYQNLSNPKTLEKYRAARAPRVPEATEPAPPPRTEAEPAPTAATPSFDTPTSRPAATPASPPSQPAAAPAPESKPSEPPPESRRRPKRRPKPSPLAKKFMRTVLEQSSQRSSGSPRSTGPDRTPAPSSGSRTQRASRKRSDSVVAKDPGLVEADARVSQAVALVARQRFVEAVQILRSALEFAPKHAQAKVLLTLCEARLLASQGKQDAAVAKYELVLELDPGHAEARQELHEVKQASGSGKGRGLFSRILTRED